MAFRFSSTAFRFPKNPRKSFYGEKYTKNRYSSFVFFGTRSPSFVITDKQYLPDYPTPHYFPADYFGDSSDLAGTGTTLFSSGLFLEAA
jgi:hypothetical protein